MKYTSLILAFFIFIKTHDAQAPLRRIAYLIGNSLYEENENVLYNPVNDVRELSKTLRDLGFEVFKFENIKRDNFIKIINSYGKELKKNPLSTVGLFYYSGHGMQIKGRNYLTPTDAEDIEDEEDVEEMCINLDVLMQNLYEAENKMNIIILDACRDNPFGYEIIQPGDENKRKGLAPMDAPVGTFIAFSTSPGKTANDGDGLNALYTQELIKAIQIPDLKIEQVFKKVRTQVKEISDGEQIPWENSSLETEFYFKRSGIVASKGKLITSTNENLPMPERFARDVCGCLSGYVGLKEKMQKLPTTIEKEKLERLKDDEEVALEQSDRCIENITKEYLESVTPEHKRQAKAVLQRICPKVYMYLLNEK